MTPTAPRVIKGVWGLLGGCFCYLLLYKVLEQPPTLLLTRGYPVIRGRYETGSQEVCLPALCFIFQISSSPVLIPYVHRYIPQPTLTLA